MTYTIAVILTDASTTSPDRLTSWTTLALRLLPEAGTIHLFGLVTVPEGTSLSEGVLGAQSLREALAAAASRDGAIDDQVRVIVDYQPFARALDPLTAIDPDLVVIQSARPDGPIGALPQDDILRALPCDVVIISGELPSLAAGSVLLSLRGGPNITLGVRVALALAGDDGAITLFHATDQRRSAPDLMLVASAVPQIERVIRADDGILDGIVREAPDHAAIVMGLSFRRPEKADQSASPVIEAVFARTGRPIALVRAGDPETLEFHAPHLIRAADQPLSERVDRWFAENTFHSSEFSTLRDLMILKEKRGTTISIALPALNEAETVGPIIALLKRTFMDDLPLVDEIVLIDSQSTDDTVAIAQGLGIPTHIHQHILANEVGVHSGKGEALWKSLHVTTGDIVAWIDTDITNIHPRFIYGLLGPLLQQPQIQYVKGFYARPIKTEGKLQAYGGGRVTELVARPLLNLFYPELSGIIQPLSGEYAGRRTALEQLPFFTGYGVETGLLLDLLNTFGLDAIAQTDLEVRIHHNQPLVNLSKMSFAILQVLITRLEAKYGVQLLDHAHRSMKLVVQEPERFALEIAGIGDVERPPIITIPAYQKIARGLVT